VTGGAGYVGSRAAKVLFEKGHDVTVVDKTAKENSSIPLPDKISYIKGDLRDSSVCERSVADKEYVLHLAANVGSLQYMHDHQAEILQENSAIDAQLYPAMAKNKMCGVVYSSSSMVFQHPEKFPYREIDIDAIRPPKNIYGFSKLLGEKFCKAYSANYGLQYAIIRYHNIYGPGEDSKGASPGDIHVIPALLEKILVKKQYPLEILGDPLATRPFVFVDDAVEATVKILEEMVAGNRNVINTDFNIGNNRHLTILELAEFIWNLVGDERDFKYKLVPTDANTALRREVNIEKIQKTIGWNPITDLKEGVLLTAQWIRERGNN